MQKQISEIPKGELQIETQTERGKATDSEKLCRSRQAERNILPVQRVHVRLQVQGPKNK